MEALTPREIQMRIRSGQSVEDVLAVAGMSAERVEAFAAPVLAEREHIAALALASPIRRAGETASHRGLRQVVAERLVAQGLDIDSVEWDAWRRSDGRWVAVATYSLDDVKHVARFVFDHQGKFSLADDEAARWLIGEVTPVATARPGPRRWVVDDTEPTIDLDEPQSVPTPRPIDHFGDELGPAPFWLEDDNQPDADDWSPIVDFTDAEDSLAPHHRSSLDTLYDMISVIDEDSVKIYRGLREPLPGLDLADQAHPRTASSPTAPPRSASPAATVEVEPATDDDDKVVPLAPPPSRRRAKRSRASVPSWDEIMFGGPPQAS
jgi:hypothetical protein